MKNESRKRVTRMYEAVVSTNAIYKEYAARNGIGYLDMQIYYNLLDSDEPMTQRMLCDILNISKTTLNSVIKRCVSAGYIELQPSDQSGREKWVRLTGEGSEYAHRLINPLFDIEKNAMAGISDEELQTVESIIHRYAESLSSGIEDM